jgi:DNA-binding phage protein
MALMPEFKQTVAARMQRDRDFRKALLIEGVQLFLDGEIESGKSVLRDYISGTGGFEKLGREADLPSKSLMRMFSKRGNPTLANLVKVLLCLEARDKVRLQIRGARRA